MRVISTSDPRTGRALGDHGPAEAAIDFAIEVSYLEGSTFLRAWRVGNAAAEWPEFYPWLRKWERGRGIR